MANDVITWTVLGLLCVFALGLAGLGLAREVLRKKTATLEQRNAALAHSILTLKQTQAHRDEFMAWVGHELRTPMNAMLGLSPLLRDALVERPAELNRLQLIQSSTQQLLDVVNDLLDFAQLQAGRLSLHEEAFALDDALSELLEKLQPQAQIKGLSLVRTPGSAENATASHIIADRHRLMQVLRHLIENAIKFTDHGEVRVRWQMTHDGLRCEVEDTGVGIAPDRHADLFKHAGLGLSICDRLVRLQRGRLGVQRGVEGGALFWLELPLKKKAKSPTPTKTWVDAPLRILLVDDQTLNLMVARNLLNKCFPHAVVIEATQGAQALEILREQAIDLALIDMLMPEMDGLQLTMALRRHLAPPACHLPVLALTASNDPSDLGRCVGAGMNGVLLKPLNEKQVIAQISQAMTAAEERAA